MPEAENAKTEAPAPKTGKFSDKDIKEGKGIAWLSYCGPLAFVPFFSNKENKYVQAHAKIGLNLFIIEGIWCVITILLGLIKVPTTYWGITVYTTPWWIGLLEAPVSIFLGVVAIIGFVNSLKGEVKELPLVGKIKFIK